ncbi:MAG: universal stress protein [Halodesulfurarchaeum sp.]
MMDTIVVPVTHHNRWNRQVANVAAELEDVSDTYALVVYRFADDLDSTIKHLDVDREEADIDEMAARKSGVTEVVETLDERGMSYAIRGTEAAESKGEELLELVEDEGADRIYMYSRKRSPAGKAIFGSGLQNVLFNSSVPVIVVPPNLE